ncbi:TrbI/VirB10 family protein [Caballeronia sordidicola]|uniref:TrbI/VirB10 family protein n=1 Tax=Caballeronia sordidicola TaxID=196367 RepID=UPI00069172A0|nr:TrbI/VirB10 family protein [Caballeronia sordidicola]
MFDQLKRNWALMTPARQKRAVVVGTILAFGAGAWIFSVKTTPPKPPSDKLSVNVVAPPQRNTDLTDVNATVTAIQRQLLDMDHRLQSQQNETEHRFSALETQQRDNPTSSGGPGALTHGQSAGAAGTNSQLPTPGSGDGISPPGSSPFPGSGQPRLNSPLPGAGPVAASPISPPHGNGDGATGSNDDQPDGIEVVGDTTDTPAASSSASGASVSKSGNTKATDGPQMFLPMGSITSGLAINGGDFPTTRASQRDPVPMLIRLDKDAILPGKQRASVKDCFLMVSGTGDLSTARANLRAERMSCVLKGGRVVEVAVDGYVVGEDGKPGLRGTLDAKDGAFIANAIRVALIGSVGEGVATYVATEASDIHSSGVNVQLGSNSNNGQQIAAPVGQAFANAAQHYTDLAKEIVPVVEINPLRQVDVILTKGVSLPI